MVAVSPDNDKFFRTLTGDDAKHIHHVHATMRTILNACDRIGMHIPHTTGTPEVGLLIGRERMTITTIQWLQACLNELTD